MGARILVAAKCVFGLREIAEAADEEIELAIVVVVEPDGATTPAGRRHAGLVRHVGESAIAIVVIENAARVLGHVQVGQAIAVVVAHRHPHPVGAAAHTGLRGDVAEGPIPVVAIEGVAQRGRRRIEVAGTAVDQVNVHPAVVIVVQKCAARADRFRQIHFRGESGHVLP